MFSDELITQLAQELDASEKSRQQVEHFSKRFPGMTIEDGSQVFPTGGTRVFAYPAPHYAVADGGAAGIAAGGDGDYGFIYLNLRMGRGSSDEVKKHAGDALLQCAKAHLQPVFDKHQLGLTVQVDEAPGQVYDGKHSTLHPLFAKH